MTAADRLAAIRHRHLYDVDLGRWDEDEVGMLAALDAVLALLPQPTAWTRMDTREAGEVYNANTVDDFVTDLRAAITDAIGGGA